MAIPQIPVTGTETVAHRRRVAESINDIIRFNFDSSRATTPDERLAGEFPVNLAYEPGDTRRWGVTDSTSSAFNKAALEKAIATSDIVTVYGATYDYLTISSSNKTLRMMDGVTIKLPNSTITSSSTSGPSVLAITGSNVTIDGDFTIDGNKANNDASGFPTTVLTGALHVSGDNCRINGTVTIDNACWRGLVVENGSSTGDEVDKFYCHRVRVTSPYYYAVMLWCLKDWSIGEIEVTRGTTTGWNARVRFGTQATSTGQCLRGRVGSIKTNGAVVTEAGTQDIDIGVVQCGGGKLQESTRVQVGRWNALGTLMGDESATSFAMLICNECTVGDVIVEGHLQSAQATSFTQDNFNCSVGSLIVKDTSTAQSDCIINLNRGLRIGAMRLEGAAAGGKGLVFQYDASAHNIYIGSLHSSGHTTNDVELASNVGSSDLIRIGSINKDAVRSIGSGHGRAAFSWTSGTASMTVSDPHCVSTSFVRVSPRDADAAVIMYTQGYYITPGSGSFQIFTGTGGNTAAQSEWDYEIDNSV